MMNNSRRGDDLKKRSKQFAMEVVRAYVRLPKTTEAQVLGKQVLRSGTSVGAQYREACRAKSDADFISKIEGALQELDETQYWIELLIDAKIGNDDLQNIWREANELTAIFVASVRTVKNRTPFS